MKTVQSLLSPKLCQYPLSLIGAEENLLFVDIETTGFTARTSQLYLIGCVYFENRQIHLVQWFAERPEEERQILECFIKRAQKHSILIHYNGNNFDIPYMKQKCLQYALQEPFSSMTGIDIYKRVMPYKKILFLENLKQRTLEQFLGIVRQDTYHGGELIHVYQDYVNAPSQECLQTLLLHNADDMRGMLSLMPMLTYADIFLQPFRVVKVQAGKVEDADGAAHTEVMMKLKFPFHFPKDAAMHRGGCRFHCHDNEGLLMVPVIYGSMKFFYSNYKDYYYLPAEDAALHKSVAIYVDPAYRQQATAATCYTKKEGAFLPQWDILFEPIFKEAYHDKVCYFELTDEMKRSPDLFKKYALHIIDMLAHGKIDEPKEDT